MLLLFHNLTDAGFVVVVVSLVPAKKHGQLQQVTLASAAASMRVPVCACVCVYVRECVAYLQLILHIQFWFPYAAQKCIKLRKNK